MRKSIPKKVRQQVFDKYKGHCAYCGRILEYKDMQIDHINPVYRAECQGKKVEESIENYMPSCRACNFYKSTFSIEEFRDNIQNKLIRKLQKDFNYKMLLQYGMIQEKFEPVVFYFEQAESEGRE